MCQVVQVATLVLTSIIIHASVIVLAATINQAKYAIYALHLA